MNSEKSIFRKVFEAVLGFYAALLVLALFVLFVCWVLSLFGVIPS